MPALLLDWLDAAKWHFWCAGIVTTSGWLVLVVAPWGRGAADTADEAGGTPRAAESRRASALWFGSSLGLLLAWRWPYLVGPYILNPDESQMLAGANTLRQFPVFWKYVDGTTHGPLSDLVLLLGNLVGVPLNYGGARFIAGALVLGGFVVLGRGLMRCYPPRVVRVALIAPMFFAASIAYYDFAGYTSESLPVFLILAATGVYLGASQGAARPAGRLAAGMAVTGALLGSLPYAKLQAIPAGAALGAMGLAGLWAARRRLGTRKAGIAAGALVSGAMFPTCVVAIYLWIFGLFPQFRIAYIESNLVYANRGWMTHGDMLRELWAFLAAAPGLQTLSLLACGAFVLAVIARTFSPGRRGAGVERAEDGALVLSFRVSRWPGARVWGCFGVVAFLGACLVTTIAPARQFGHYLQFLLPALGVMLAVGLAEINDSPWARRFAHLSGTAGALALGALLILPLLAARAHRADPDMHGHWTQNNREWRTATGLAIKDLARPGDTLSVWGWMPHFYVEAGLPQATREAHTYGQITPGPLQDFFRQRFLRDFARSSPRIFVDAVAPGNFGFHDRATQGHESFPELGSIISRDFQLHSEIEGNRLYLRRETGR